VQSACLQLCSPSGRALRDGCCQGLNKLGEWKVLDTRGTQCRIGVLTRCNNRGLLDPPSTPLSSPYSFVCRRFFFIFSHQQE
jgi:hypothetical protein